MLLVYCSVFVFFSSLSFFFAAFSFLSLFITTTAILCFFLFIPCGWIWLILPKSWKRRVSFLCKKQSERWLHLVLNYHCSSTLALNSFLFRTDCQQYVLVCQHHHHYCQQHCLFATLADLSSQPAAQPLLKLGELQSVLMLLLPVPSQFVSNLSNRWAVAIFFSFFIISFSFFPFLSFSLFLPAVCADKSFRPAYDLIQNRLLLSCVSNWQSSAVCCCCCLWWPTGMCFKLSCSESCSFPLPGCACAIPPLTDLLILDSRCHREFPR